MPSVPHAVEDRQTEFVGRPVQAACVFRRTLAQERNDFVQERNVGCHTRKTQFDGPCSALALTSGPDLGSTLARTSRQTAWEDANDLEDSEDCRSAGGHGNQHVRLRCAQIDRIKTICPARSAIVASSRGRRPPNDLRSLGRHRPSFRASSESSTWRSGQVAPSPADIRPCPGVSRTSRSGVAISRSWLLYCGRVLALPSLSIHPLPSECECQRVPIRFGGDPVLFRAASGLAHMPRASIPSICSAS